ncbi:spore cortex biosynthesis protein YabQ [Desulfofundulus thermobenzoicus]|uniref:spore cortex biosynthesis protein YabQ n=1 Tax=Desulfofundulus thermobenzoicus TaxID=29376 RepID=UPI0018844D43
MTLAEQLNSFLFTLLIGLMSGFAYDLYRVFREMVRPRRWGTYLGDFLIWVFLLVATFAALLVINYGEVRFYVLLGLALGAAIYLTLFSGPARRLIYRCIYLLARLARLVAAGAALLWRVVTFPFKVLVFVTAWPVVQAGRGFGLAGRRIGRAGRRIAGPPARRLSGNLRARWRSLFHRGKPPPE